MARKGISAVSEVTGREQRVRLDKTRVKERALGPIKSGVLKAPNVPIVNPVQSNTGQILGESLGVVAEIGAKLIKEQSDQERAATSKAEKDRKDVEDYILGKEIALEYFETPAVKAILDSDFATTEEQKVAYQELFSHFYKTLGQREGMNKAILTSASTLFSSDLTEREKIAFGIAYANQTDTQQQTLANKLQAGFGSLTFSAQDMLKMVRSNTGQGKAFLSAKEATLFYIDQVTARYTDMVNNKNVPFSADQKQGFLDKYLKISTSDGQIKDISTLKGRATTIDTLYQNLATEQYATLTAQNKEDNGNLKSAYKLMLKDPLEVTNKEAKALIDSRTDINPMDKEVLFGDYLSVKWVKLGTGSTATVRRQVGYHKFPSAQTKQKVLDISAEMLYNYKIDAQKHGFSESQVNEMGRLYSEKLEKEIAKELFSKDNITTSLLNGIYPENEAERKLATESLESVNRGLVERPMEVLNQAYRANKPNGPTAVEAREDIKKSLTTMVEGINSDPKVLELNRSWVKGLFTIKGKSAAEMGTVIEVFEEVLRMDDNHKLLNLMNSTQVTLLKVASVVSHSEVGLDGTQEALVSLVEASQDLGNFENISALLANNDDAAKIFKGMDLSSVNKLKGVYSLVSQVMTEKDALAFTKLAKGTFFRKIEVSGRSVQISNASNVNMPLGGEDMLAIAVLTRAGLVKENANAGQVGETKRPNNQSFNTRPTMDKLPKDIEVVDGDTFKIGGVTHRLIGVDTAETGPFKLWSNKTSEENEEKRRSYDVKMAKQKANIALILGVDISDVKDQTVYDFGEKGKERASKWIEANKGQIYRGFPAGGHNAEGEYGRPLSDLCNANTGVCLSAHMNNMDVNTDYLSPYNKNTTWVEPLVKGDFTINIHSNGTASVHYGSGFSVSSISLDGLVPGGN